MWIIPVAAGGVIIGVLLLAFSSKASARTRRRNGAAATRPLVYQGQDLGTPEEAVRYLHQVAPAVVQQGDPEQARLAVVSLQQLGQSPPPALVNLANQPANGDVGGPTVALPPPTPSVPGYDPETARSLAPVLDRELRRLGTGTRDERSRRQTGATHRALQAFARAAFGDAAVDAEIARNRYWGYGGGTRGALIAYGITNPPQPIVRPLNTVPYVAPT